MLYLLSDWESWLSLRIHQWLKVTDITSLFKVWASEFAAMSMFVYFTNSLIFLPLTSSAYFVLSFFSGF